MSKARPGCVTSSRSRWATPSEQPATRRARLILLRCCTSTTRSPPREQACYKPGYPNLSVNGQAMSNVQQRIDELVKGNRVVLFMKGNPTFPKCGFSGRAVQILKACGVTELKTVNVLEDEEIRQGIKEYANWPTIPQLYINGEFVGGSDIMMEMYQAGELQQVLGGQQ